MKCLNWWIVYGEDSDKILDTSLTIPLGMLLG